MGDGVSVQDIKLVITVCHTSKKLGERLNMLFILRTSKTANIMLMLKKSTRDRNNGRLDIPETQSSKFEDTAIEIISK